MFQTLIGAKRVHLRLSFLYKKYFSKSTEVEIFKIVSCGNKKLILSNVSVWSYHLEIFILSLTLKATLEKMKNAFLPEGVKSILKRLIYN